MRIGHLGLGLLQDPGRGGRRSSHGGGFRALGLGRFFRGRRSGILGFCGRKGLFLRRLSGSQGILGNLGSLDVG